MNSFIKTLITFSVGTLVGVLIGFLYAPESGRKTRTRLKKASGKLGDLSRSDHYGRWSHYRYYGDKLYEKENQ